MSGIFDTVERLVSGTPIELTARLMGSRLAALKGPRQRQAYNYKRQTIEIIRRVMGPESSGVDVGAHKGLFLLAMLRHAPRGRHVAVEPLPDLARDLARRFPTVVVHEKALSDRVGSIEFVQVLEEPGLSAMQAWSNQSHLARHTIRVQTSTLDELFGDASIDFLKIDAMGAQFEVLKGGRGLLAKRRLHCVFTHRNPPERDPRPVSEAISDLAQGDLGMKISRLEDWLEGRPALTKDAFCRSTGHHDGSEFCFLLHP